MRNLVMALLLAFVGQSAMAKAKYGMAGCGLGSVMMGDKNQVFAATSNDIGTAGFAISSGTSNCDSGEKTAAIQAQENFFTANLKILSKEMAQGDGQYVRAFAETMGCNENARGTFGAEMQKSYSDIFSAPGTGAMLNRVRSVIHQNKDLNSNCNTVI